MSEILPESSESELRQLRAKVDQLDSALRQLREAHQRLQQLERRRASHLSQTPVAMIFWDRQFRVLEWNRSAERIFGYTEQEAIGRHGCDLIVAPDARPHVEQVFQELLQQTGGRRSTNENVTKDGHCIQCEWYNTPLLDAEQQVVGVASIAQDITEQKETAEALARSEGMLRLILDHAPDVVMRIDRLGRISYINRVAPPYKRQDVMGQRMVDFVAPEQQTIVSGAIERVFATGQVEEYDVQDVVMGRWYRTRLAPLSEEGRVDFLVAISLDIDDRKREQEELQKSQDALRESEALFRVLAENVPGVVYLCHNDDRYSMIFLNDAIEQLVGFPASDFLADHISFIDLFHPDDATVIPPTVNSAIARRAPYHLTYRLKRKDGSYVWAEEYGQGVFDDKGSLKFLEGTIFDITEKRAAIDALRRSNEELEEQVQSRTQQLRMANRLLRGDYQRQLELTRELKASEEKFRVIIDANPAPVVIARLDDSEIVYANERTAELLGTSQGLIVGRKTVDFYHNIADRDQLRENLQRTGTLQGHEIQLRRPDGKILWVNLSMRILDLDFGRCVLAMMIDVTQRREYDERFKSERRLLRRLLELHERDRQLIAYEIHDGFVQDVTGAIMFLQAATRKFPAGDSAPQELDKGVEILRNAINEARRLIDGLQPGVLEEQGVVEGVRYLAQQIKQMHGTDVELQIDVQFDRLAPSVEQAIYRIVQEGLNNVVKHSKSPRARVVISQRTDALVIKVEDWGVGFNTLTTRSRRYGLTGIRDRARLLGGKAKIRSEPGVGTRLRVKLPLNDVLIPTGWQMAELSDDDSSSGITAQNGDSVS
jgi:PAS domain S-box-containing protein